jgi:hypothetical protein
MISINFFNYCSHIHSTREARFVRQTHSTGDIKKVMMSGFR